MTKQNLLGYTIEQCEELMVSLGEKPYRGRQLFKWLYSTRQYDFNLMSDISKSVRSTLDEKYEFRFPKLIESQKSSDGTEKFLFHMDDGSPVETVLIPDDNSDRKTVCIS